MSTALHNMGAHPGSDMTIYYTVNTASMPYLDTFREELEVPSLEVNQNWTSQEQVLPISLQSTPFDNKLPKAPGTLKGLVQQYRQKSQTLDKSHQNKTKSKFFDNIAIDIFFHSSYYFYASGSCNYTHYMQTCKTKSFINRNCFSVSKTSRSSGNQSDKTALYSTMVCNCSIDYDDNITYCIHLPNHSEMYYILREDFIQTQ